MHRRWDAAVAADLDATEFAACYVETLRRHKASQAAERLAAVAWVPWEEHSDLVFPTAIGTPTDPRNALRAFAGIAALLGWLVLVCTR